MVKFILITSQRTGSTYISNYLHNHPQIAMYEEIMLKNSSTPGGLKQFVNSNKLKNFLFNIYNLRIIKKIHSIIPIFIPINIIMKQYLEAFFSRDKEYVNNNNIFNNLTNQLDEDPKAIGFKLMINQIKNNPYLKNWIIENNLKIIILKRRNILKKYISSIASYKRKIAHSTKQVEKVKINIDLLHLKKYIHNTNNEYLMLDTFKKDNDYICINYEDFFSNPELQVTDLFNFLGVDRKVNIEKPILKKLNTQSLDEIINNCDEVIKYLKNNNINYIFRGQ